MTGILALKSVDAYNCDKEKIRRRAKNIQEKNAAEDKDQKDNKLQEHD